MFNILTGKMAETIDQLTKCRNNPLLDRSTNCGSPIVHILNVVTEI